MNIHQKHLLDLLKEIDSFSREHGITYYCAGGTVIGAARHRGFIPWDDDIDIYMTRENFFKFDEALKKYGPPKRKLEYYEGNHERQAAVARYHKDDDTMFCHFNMLGHSSAGTSIDVFILDPLPDDFEARLDYRAKLYAYTDLIAPCNVYSHRLPVSRYDVYDKYRKIAKEEGRPRAVEMISDELFHYDAKECEAYTLRWGAVTLIYPVKVIGEPVYLPFEDMMIPVPQDWYQYLAIHYGMDWYNLPYEETQGEHINIVRYDMDYEYFYKKRDEIFTQDYLLDLHYRWKDAERDFFRVAEPMKDFARDTQNKICRLNIEKRLAKTLKEKGAENLEALYDAGEYRSIVDAYAPYIQMQTRIAYMGGPARHSQQFRWNFPFIVPVSETELRCVLGSLLRTGGQRTVEKIVGAYGRAGAESAAIDEIRRLIDVLNMAGKLYYRGDYEECLALINDSREFGDFPMLSDYRWLASVKTGLTGDEEAQLKKAAEAPDAGYSVRKAWGDLLWDKGKVKDAEKVYRDLMKNCRNGLFWMDIRTKVPDIDPIPTKRLTPFSETGLTLKQRELLEEIAAICRENDIKYVLGPDLARRIYLTGNIGHVNSNREIFMDAEGAAKFIKAFGESGRDDRRLKAWNSGDRIRDFALAYCDINNVFCDFRRLDQWRDMGIFITIRILRSGNLSKGQKRREMLDEFFVNLLDMEGIDKRNLQSAAKKLVYGAARVLPAASRNSIKRKAFERSLDMESSAVKSGAAGKGSLYYYTNIRGMRPVKHKFTRSMWEDTCEAEMNGVKYTIPSVMTGKYVPRETDLSNVPPFDSIFNYSSSEMSWDEISPLIDFDAYADLDWKGYARTRRAFRKLKNDVWRDWWAVLKLGEELDVNEAAEETIKAYKAAMEAGDELAAGDAMAKTDALVKEYAALDVAIELDPALNECYEDYLKKTGQGEFLKAWHDITPIGNLVTGDGSH